MRGKKKNEGKEKGQIACLGKQEMMEKVNGAFAFLCHGWVCNLKYTLFRVQLFHTSGGSLSGC